jgi:hypothetical protein
VLDVDGEIFYAPSRSSVLAAQEDGKALGQALQTSPRRAAHLAQILTRNAATRDLAKHEPTLTRFGSSSKRNVYHHILGDFQAPEPRVEPPAPAVEPAPPPKKKKLRPIHAGQFWSEP